MATKSQGSTRSPARGRHHPSGLTAAGPPEETVLETFFVMLSKMNFDKAREHCERERDIKSTSGGGVNWCDFMSALSKLAQAETVYFNLAFMEKSWRRRKEPPKAVYENVVQELTRVYGVYYRLKGGTDIAWERKMADLVSITRDYLQARKDMMDFYLRFEQTESLHLDFKGLSQQLKEIQDRYKDSCQHIFLRPVKTILLREVNTLMDLINAQQEMAVWQFLPAIVSLQSAHSKLSSWNSIVPLGNQGDRVARALRHSRQVSPPPQSALPRLYKWICRFFTYLLAKFTLYFHTTLSEHSAIYDMKHLSTKIDYDYINHLSVLVRQTPAICISLVFDSNGLPDFNGPKYSFPNSPSAVRTGLNSYPFMVSIPHGFDLYHHRANIISTIISRSGHLSSSAQFITQHDEAPMTEYWCKIRSPSRILLSMQNLACTYFLTQVEQRITLVAICSSRGKDRDSKTLSALTDFVSDLRPLHIAAILRTN